MSRRRHGVPSWVGLIESLCDCLCDLPIVPPHLAIALAAHVQIRVPTCTWERIYPRTAGLTDSAAASIRPDSIGLCVPVRNSAAVIELLGLGVAAAAATACSLMIGPHSRRGMTSTWDPRQA
jgi:hypothetical protein